METPEQQRRPSLGDSIQQLRRDFDRYGGLSFDAVDVADMLWLSQFIELGQDIPDQSDEASDTDAASDANVTVIYDETEPRDTPVGNIVLDELVQSPETTEPKTNQRPQGLPFAVPAAPALRTRLELARSLRPLMRKVASRQRFRINENKTVTQVAETQRRIWSPVTEPEVERWLDLELVVEDAKTTTIWERTIGELENLVTYQGAFRTMRTWRMSIDGDSVTNSQVLLYPRWHEPLANRPHQVPHSPRELLDSSGRRLIMMVTDATSAAWRSGAIHHTLWTWSKRQPIAVIQMLPEQFWARTALNYGEIVRLSSLAPGLPSDRWQVDRASDSGLCWEGDDDSASLREMASDYWRLTLPVVTLAPHALKKWASVMVGAGDTRIPGRLFEFEQLRDLADQYKTQRLSTTTQSLTARARFARFWSTASDTAKLLAGYIAATPVSLPVVDLLRDEFVPQARQHHVTEVLLGGLLQRCHGKDGREYYQFYGDDLPVGAETDERVRSLLLERVPVNRTAAVLNRLSGLIKDRSGKALSSFKAFLELYEQEGNRLSSDARPLAQVGVSVLRHMGGQWGEMARRYGLVVEPDFVPRRFFDGGFPLEEMEVVTIELVREQEVPSMDFPLQSDEVEIVEIETVLDRFTFETATIERSTGLRGLLQSNITLSGLTPNWEITKSPGEAWGVVEPLGDGVTLNMISIPAGSFTREQDGSEVTLDPFYMGSSAVTQDQWRVVASYPAVERKLEAEPSRFKGDRRPVEQVSWEEAVEFCRRLSVATGKTYQLPSEAQWEYACRAGTTTPFHFGETLTDGLANYDARETDNGGPKGQYRESTTAVASFPANAWGLYDMHGNVWEWCEDDWHGDFEGIPGDSPNDGSAWVEEAHTVTSKLLRGGSWNFYPWSCRSAVRDDYRRDVRYHYIGFRVCCVPPRAL